MSPKTKSTTLRLMFVLAALVGGVAFLMSLAHPPVRAASTYTVNSLADTDDAVCDAANCTLREAIKAANADPGSTINFTVTGTITLTSPLPAIVTVMTINGPGASQLTVSGADSFRVFLVEANSEDPVTFDGLTISDGLAPDTDPNGGGISNTAELNISNCVITGNSAPLDGGGISSFNGFTTITNTTISGNNAGRNGGGVSGRGNITNSTISGNSAAINGGGVNGVFRSITNSTIVGNSANQEGGGLWLIIGEIKNCTISGNSAPQGSGLRVNFFVEMTSSIVALNTGGGTDTFGNVASHGYNVIGTGDNFSPGPEDQVGVTAAQLKLGPLANNGGPTETMALSCGSVAIDKGLNTFVDIPPKDAAISVATGGNDQRGPGFARTFDDPNKPNATGGDGTDVGAFEVQSACATVPTNKDQCKNNGWKTVTRPDGSPFKNQGDCIQFVNTGK
ncbi:MAG: choice-of-anchor Q domain-containing protein [Acidobacteriota bacterium]